MQTIDGKGSAERDIELKTNWVKNYLKKTVWGIDDGMIVWREKGLTGLKVEFYNFLGASKQER